MGKAKPKASRPATGSDRPAKRSDRSAKRNDGPARRTSRPSRQEKETTTEQRIKEAARKLFTQKGFAGTRTRDIAEEAGLNLALLNYYFRSKQKLFDLIMMENFRQFIQGISVNFLDDTLTIEQRVSSMVTAYIDFLTKFPDLPLFVLNEIKGNPSKLAATIRDEIAPARSHFFQQLQAAYQAGKIALDPFHFVANLVGLTIFPFVGRPLLQRVNNVDDEQFAAYMQQRKELVPKWIMLMLAPK